ncbi:unnamed protein product [Amoebophrya sp. A120]|nr:unnamed protein product [Amoebophrya sp. A120]|eukprot:GSA120T00016858001.1
MSSKWKFAPPLSCECLRREPQSCSTSLGAFSIFSLRQPRSNLEVGMSPLLRLHRWASPPLCLSNRFSTTPMLDLLHQPRRAAVAVVRRPLYLSRPHLRNTTDSIPESDQPTAVFYRRRKLLCQEDDRPCGRRSRCGCRVGEWVFRRMRLRVRVETRVARRHR